MLMVFEIAPETKGCAAAIMRIWLSVDRWRVPLRPQAVAQSNTARCASFRCGAPSSVMAPQQWRFAASISAREKPSSASMSNPASSSAAASRPSAPVQKASPNVHLLNAYLMSNALFRASSSLTRASSVEAAVDQRLVVDPRRLLEAAMPQRIAGDVADLVGVVAEPLESFGNGAVDDAEVAAAGQLLVLDDGEIGLDAGGVAVHDEADRAGRGDHRGLRVAVAVLLARAQGEVPCPRRRRRQGRVGAGHGVERHRVDRQRLVAAGFAVGRAPMVAHHPQHRLAVVAVAREGAELGRHLRRGGVADPAHDRRDRRADRPSPVAVIGHAGGHQERADVGVAEAERAVLVRQRGDAGRGELRHQHRDLEHQRPQAHGVLEGGDVEAAVPAPVGHQVERGQVAGRVVEEHVLGAGVGGADLAAAGAGVPVVDRGVVLHARIGGSPRGVADLVPQLARPGRARRPRRRCGERAPSRRPPAPRARSRW